MAGLIQPPKASIVQVFGRYVPRDIAAQLVSNPTWGRTKEEPESRQLTFLLILLAEHDPLPLEERFESVLALAVPPDGFVECLSASLILATAGMWEDATQSRADWRVQTLVKLRQQGCGSLRIVHGRRTCPVGHFGTNSVRFYQAAIPDFTHWLAELLALPPGGIKAF